MHSARPVAQRVIPLLALAVLLGGCWDSGDRLGHTTDAAPDVIEETTLDPPLDPEPDPVPDPVPDGTTHDPTGEDPAADPAPDVDPAPTHWIVTVGDTANEVSFADVLPLPDGTILAMGEVADGGADGSALLLVRIDGRGRVLEQRIVPGLSRDGPGEGVVLEGGDIVVSSTIAVGSEVGPDLWLARLAPDLTIRWQKLYGGPGDEDLPAVVTLPDGTLAVSCTTASFSDREDIWLLHLDPDGEILQQVALDGGARDWHFGPRSLAASPDGTVHVTWTHETGASLMQVVSAWDPGTGLSWSRFIDAGADTMAIAISADPDGLLVSGSASSGMASWPDQAWIQRLDLDGDVVWRRYTTFDGYEELGQASLVRAVSGGRIAVAGSIGETWYPPTERGWLAVLDPEGWTHVGLVLDAYSGSTFLTVWDVGDAFVVGGNLSHSMLSRDAGLVMRIGDDLTFEGSCGSIEAIHTGETLDALPSVEADIAVLDTDGWSLETGIRPEPASYPVETICPD